MKTNQDTEASEQDRIPLDFGSFMYFESCTFYYRYTFHVQLVRWNRDSRTGVLSFRSDYGRFYVQIESFIHGQSSDFNHLYMRMTNPKQSNFNDLKE